MSKPTLVILESPYAAPIGTPLPRRAEAIWHNTLYARACMRHSLSLDEAPIASHLLYTQEGVLRDHIAAEREAGIAAGLAWLRVAEKSIFYLDFGMSIGMSRGHMAAEAAGVPTESRYLPGEFWPHALNRNA